MSRSTQMAGGTVKEPARDVGGGHLVAIVTGNQTDQESRSAGTEPQVDLLDGVGHGRACAGGNDERKEGHAEVHG